MASAQTTNTENKLQKILDKRIDNKKVFGTIVNIQKGDGSFSFAGSSGNLNKDTQYFIASTTKLYMTALILKFRALNKLNLDDKISLYLPEYVMNGLHIYKATDYSELITIRHLLAHTSGLPDYFQQKNDKGTSLLKEILAGKDRYLSFDDILTESKKLKPQFKPGTKGKAYYSDTNFQLLGRIIEIISGKSLTENYEEHIFTPLGLTKTYLYEVPNDTTPVDIYYKNKTLHIPLMMSSFGPDGGIVSTAEESMSFIKAFFQGQFFPKAYIEELKEWNNIFYPMQSGVGIHRFAIPWIFSPFRQFPEWIGHSGMSGALAYYCPERDLFFTGTVNQIHDPGTIFRLMIRLLNNID